MYKFLNLDYRRPLKCGAAAGIGAIIGGVGAVTSGIGGMISADDAVDTNVEENEKNRKFNAEEAQKQRDWASEEWQRQFGQQSEQWYQQQDYANKQSYDYWLKQQQYMSPVEQNRRLLQAGLNPAHVIGDTSFGGTGLSAAPVSVPNPSVPSGSAASVSTSNPVSAVDKASAFERAASGLTKIVDAIGSFSKNTAEAESTRAQLQPILDNWLLKNTNQELLNSYQEMYNAFFSKSAPKELKLLGEKINNVIADTIVKQVSGELIEEQTITEQFKQILTDKDIRLRGEQYLQAVAVTANIETQLKLQNRLMQEQAKTERARQSESYSVARLNDAKKLTEDLIRTPRVWGQQVINSIGRGEMKLQDVRLKLENVKLSKEEASKVVAELERDRARSIIEHREDDPSFALFDDLIYEIKDIFHVGFGYVSGDRKQPSHVHRERHNDKGEYLFDDEWYNYRK